MSSLGSFVDLVLPMRCVGCRRPGVLLCERCAPVGGATPVRWGRHGSLDVAAAAPYSAGVRRGLIAYKERGRRDLAGPLGRLLAAAIDAVLDAVPGGLPDGVPGPRAGPAPGRMLLVGVPSARRAASERGGDHVLRLARHAARHTASRTVAARVLHLDRSVLDSAGLGIADRARNMDGAMRAGPPRGGAAVLVDDIVTTGATLCEAQRALVSAGWTVLGAAVVASTPRRVDVHPLALLSNAV